MSLKNGPPEPNLGRTWRDQIGFYLIRVLCQCGAKTHGSILMARSHMISPQSWKQIYQDWEASLIVIILTSDYKHNFEISVSCLHNLEINSLLKMLGFIIHVLHLFYYRLGKGKYRICGLWRLPKLIALNYSRLTCESAPSRHCISWLALHKCRWVIHLSRT